MGKAFTISGIVPPNLKIVLINYSMQSSFFYSIVCTTISQTVEGGGNGKPQMEHLRFTLQGNTEGFCKVWQSSAQTNKWKVMFVCKYKKNNKNTFIIFTVLLTEVL